MERENKQEKEEVTYESNKKANSERKYLNTILVVIVRNANIVNIDKIYVVGMQVFTIKFFEFFRVAEKRLNKT